ncbi:hypothetical protein [Nocardioides pacificus]
MIRRRERPDVVLPAGEKALAWAATPDGRFVVGTRDAVYLPADSEVAPGQDAVRIPWEDVEGADWDADGSRLRVTEVGSWGTVRPDHRLELTDPALLLQLVRERVTASIVLQRRVSVEGRKGLAVIARRAPRGDRPMRWFFEYDEGVDPEDPAVAELATQALADARSEVGDL